MRLGIAPSELLKLDAMMLNAIIDVMHEDAREAEDARRSQRTR